MHRRKKVEFSGLGRYLRGKVESTKFIFEIIAYTIPDSGNTENREMLKCLLNQYSLKNMREY